MTYSEMLGANRGDKIHANGFDGTFVKIYDVCGMIEVYLPGGLACIPREDAQLIK